MKFQPNIFFCNTEKGTALFNERFSFKSVNFKTK